MPLTVKAAMTYREERELAKQLNTYADGIAAFAVVQGVAFCLLTAQSVSMACAERSRWYIAAPLVIATTGIYLFLIRQCQNAEDRLIGIPSRRGEMLASVVRLIRVIRFWVILAVGGRRFSAYLRGRLEQAGLRLFQDS